MTSKAKAPSDLESVQAQEAPDHDLQESEAGESTAEPMEASLEVAADSSEDSAAATKTRRPLTPEQHQRKILRDRERRALKSQEKAKALASSKPVPFDESLTQEERDRPYRQRLSAMIQAADAARFNRVMESQKRRAEGKEKSVTR